MKITDRERLNWLLSTISWNGGLYDSDTNKVIWSQADVDAAIRRSRKEAK